MRFSRFSTRMNGAFALAVLLLATSGCRFESVQAEEEAPQAEATTPQEQANLFIENESELPVTFPGERYEVHFHARGGVPVLHWRLEKGALPKGITLDDSGFLHGAALRPGEFQFTVSATDSGKPQQAVQKVFVVRVISGLTLDWKTPARVNGNRIDGSVEVSNLTPDDLDLTFIVLAVAADGRATAIGYQHFSLPRGAREKELPFGDTLPRGGYVVHVDAIGEVPPKKLIYRQRMQTPGALQVSVGP